MATREEVHGFTHPGEYGRFLEFIRVQVASGQAEEVADPPRTQQAGVDR